MVAREELLTNKERVISLAVHKVETISQLTEEQTNQVQETKKVQGAIQADKDPLVMIHLTNTEVRETTE